MKATKTHQSKIVPIAPGIVPGLNHHTHRLLDAEDVICAGDEFSPFAGIWHLCPSRWYGKQAGQIFHLPGSEDIADRSEVLIRAHVRRAKPVNARRQASLARRFARWIGLPMPSAAALLALSFLLNACNTMPPGYGVVYRQQGAPQQAVQMPHYGAPGAGVVVRTPGNSYGPAQYLGKIVN